MRTKGFTFECPMCKSEVNMAIDPKTGSQVSLAFTCQTCGCEGSFGVHPQTGAPGYVISQPGKPLGVKTGWLNEVIQNAQEESEQLPEWLRRAVR